MQKKTLTRRVESVQEAGDLFALIEPTPGHSFSVPVVGTLVSASAGSEPLVDFPGNPFAGPVRARSTVSVEAMEPGRELLLVFESGDPRLPVVIGAMRASAVVSVSGAADSEGREVRIDGRRLVFEADQEIELRCGDSSLTLRRDGKVVIRGRELLSRSSGRNRIKGAAVQIN